MCIGIVSCLKTALFYGFHIKTVRFPYRERTVSNWRTYGFVIKNIKGSWLKTDSETVKKHMDTQHAMYP